jgi:uncharacterized protein YqkB
MSPIEIQEFLEYWFKYYLSLGYNEEEAVLLAEKEFKNRN